MWHHNHRRSLLREPSQGACLPSALLSLSVKWVQDVTRPSLKGKAEESISDLIQRALIVLAVWLGLNQG